jgi:uncharacterized protein (DUF58 family)
MTENYRNYFDPRTLAELKDLRVAARTIVEGYLAGLHRSPHQGYSVEFAEHREYVPGDDLRYVDWKVFGRTDRIYLKQFVEETNFTCHLLLDCSESMNYRSASAALSKFEYARILTAVLAYLVIHQQDAAGLGVFGQELREFVRPSGSPQQLSQMVSALERIDCGGETALGPMLHEMSDRIRHRGVVVLLSDLFDDAESLRVGLMRLRHRRHDVRVLQIVDPAELSFPFDEPTLFRGLERVGEQMVDPRGLRQAYLDEFSRFLAGTRKVCRDLGFEHYLIATDRPVDRVLRSIFTDRAPEPLPVLT